MLTIWFVCPSSRQYRGNEGQMRELQDQLEAEQYFSVSRTQLPHSPITLLSGSLTDAISPVSTSRRFIKLR